MPFITAKDGAELYRREWGEGAPILFLSSLGCDSRMWDYQIAAFADEGFRCIGFDRRGHGRSDNRRAAMTSTRSPTTSPPSSIASI
jgi:pimeloyl-ACP methyl ester carboxylesterase